MLSFAAWLVVWRVLCEFGVCTKLAKVAVTLEGRLFFRGLQQADRKLETFSSDKCNACTWGRATLCDRMGWAVTAALQQRYVH